jgi:hypothetical protein
MPRKREQIKVEEKEVNPEAKDVLEFIRSSFNVRMRPTSQYSVIGKILPIESEPAILIYGPSKTGKTRIAMWEASALAREMNRRVLALFTEANMEMNDFADLLYMCMYHNVYCELVKLDHLKGIRYFINKLQRTITSTAKKNPEELEKMARVYIIDSMTALSELVTSSLSEGILDNPQTVLAYQNPYQIAIIDPLRRVISQHILSGFLIMTAHETQTRGEPYNPKVPQVKAKPRYISAGRYKEDAEIYFTDNIFDSLKTCKETASGNWRRMRALVTVRSRRNPDSEGRGIAIEFTRVTGSVEGKIEVEESVGSVTYRFIPADMLEEGEAVPLKYSSLVPQIRCGPKYI